MLDDFLFRAFLGGALVAAVAGPLGCFVVWRRMAYFGDTMAHSALLGVALGLLLGLQPLVGVLAIVVLAALTLFGLERLRWMASDTALGMLSHGTLAIGMVAATLLTDVRLDLMSYLFGDILAIGRGDIIAIAVGGAAALAVLVAIWRPLLAATVQADLAAAEGVAVGRVRLVFALLIAVLIAGAMKIVGILLVTALLIMPAAAARRLSGSPESMALIAALVGILAVGGGLGFSYVADTPSGPSIVVAAIALFLLALAAAAALRRTAPR